MKKFALTLVLCLCWLQPAFASYTLLTHTAAASTDANSVMTSSIDTSSCGSTCLIVIAKDWYADGGSCTLADSASNTWTSLTSHATSANEVTQLFYAFNPTTSGTHIFSCSGSGGQPSLGVLVFTGSVTSPADQETGSSADAGTLATGSITPMEDNELIVTSLLDNSNDVNVSIDSSFTVEDIVAASSGQHVSVSMAYIVQTSAGSVNPTWTAVGADRMAAHIATFKAAAAAGGPPIGTLNLLGVGR